MKHSFYTTKMAHVNFTLRRKSFSLCYKLKKKYLLSKIVSRSALNLDAWQTMVHFNIFSNYKELYLLILVLKSAVFFVTK